MAVGDGMLILDLPAATLASAKFHCTSPGPSGVVAGATGRGVVVGAAGGEELSCPSRCRASSDGDTLTRLSSGAVRRGERAKGR